MINTSHRLVHIDADGNPTDGDDKAGWMLDNLRRWNDGRYEVKKAGVWTPFNPYVHRHHGGGDHGSPSRLALHALQ